MKKDLRNFVMMLALGLSMIGLLSCNGGGGGGGGGTSTSMYPTPSTVDSFVTLLHQTYGGNFLLVKGPEETDTEGFAVVWDEDMGAYYAYDLANYYSGQSWSSYQANVEYQPVYIHDQYVDSWGETLYAGDAYDWSGTYRGEFLFEETEMTSKDLEKIGAMEEAYNVSKIGEALSAHYGLSEERGSKIAKLAVEWKKLSKSRSMTDADASAFTRELVGVELNEAREVMNNYATGEEAGMEDFISSAAEANETTPEHMREIIGLLMN